MKVHICKAKDCEEIATKHDIVTQFKYCSRHFEKYAKGFVDSLVDAKCPKCERAHRAKNRRTYCSSCKESLRGVVIY